MCTIYMRIKHHSGPSQVTRSNLSTEQVYRKQASRISKKQIHILLQQWANPGQGRPVLIMHIGVFISFSWLSLGHSCLRKITFIFFLLSQSRSSWYHSLACSARICVERHVNTQTQPSTVNPHCICRVKNVRLQVLDFLAEKHYHLLFCTNAKIICMLVQRSGIWRFLTSVSTECKPLRTTGQYERRRHTVSLQQRSLTSIKKTGSSHGKGCG